MAEEIKLAILVEKKAALRKEIASHLSGLGGQQTIKCATPFPARRTVVSSNSPGLLIIGNSDNLRDCYDLIAFCRARKANWTIIVLDHINSEESVLDAFSAGADDVLNVPFSNAEFSARLRVRIAQAADSKMEQPSDIKPIFDDVLLTHTEFKIMNFLVHHKGKTVTRNEIARHIDDKDWVYGDRKYDVHITNIRKKLKDKLDARYLVKSVRSVGYYIQENGNN
ncbi:MAG: response regulator transcription factor [Rhodobacteraceae bacterium]|nr:response regulator transcription factor [Paracoccaceae bacterium]